MCELGTTRKNYDLSLRRHETGDARKSITQFTALCSPVLFLTRISCTGREEGEVPRINVDDCLFHDPRWFGLLSIIEEPSEALGKLVLFWFTGQKYWDGEESVIPEEAMPPAFGEVVRAGFGEEVEGGVRVCGAKNYFSWLGDRAGAGRIGGIASAKRPRDRLGRLLPSTSKQVQAAKQPSNKTPSIQASSSSSSSSSKKNNTYASNEKISFSAEHGFVNLNGKRELWKKAYPAVNIDQEILKAQSWLIANPKNKKKNYERFLINWFTRSQERAPRVQTKTLEFEDAF